jgi:hypothetical protein
MFRVNLTANEVMVCRILAGLRDLSNNSQSVVERKISPRSSFDVNLDGVLSEYAFCKRMNIFMDMSVKPRSGSYDCLFQNFRIDIKSIRNPKYDMFTTLKENDAVDIYALAIMEADDNILFVGYATKKEFIRPENIKDWGFGDTYSIGQKLLRKWDKKYWDEEFLIDAQND